MAEQVAAPADDPTILGAMTVLRRVPRGDFNPATGVPNSDVFSPRPGEGLSVTLNLAQTDLAATRVGHEDFDIIELAVKNFRACGLHIVRDPLPDNPNHCEIFGSTTRGQKRALAKVSAWVVGPRPKE